MALYTDTLEIIKGDTKPYTITVKNSTGTAFNLTGYTIKFSVKNHVDDTDAAAIISASGVITLPATGGIFTINLTATQTNVAAGDYIYDIQIDNGSTVVKTIAKGTFRVLPDVTRTSY
jgi:hypothetical protein